LGLEIWVFKPLKSTKILESFYGVVWNRVEGLSEDPALRKKKKQVTK